MTKVGIYVDYKHNDTTLAAVMLGNWFIRSGNPVRFISNGPVARNVDDYWDSKVLRDFSGQGGCYSGLSHVFWFYPDELSLKAAKFEASQSDMVASPCHFYVPGWCDVAPLSDDFLLNADKTISLSQDAAIWLSSKCRDFEVNTAWSNLCAADKLLAVKNGRVENDKIKILVLLGSDFSTTIGEELFEVIANLLRLYSGLHVTFAMERSLPKPQRRRLAGLIQAFGSRVCRRGVVPYSRYHEMAYSHDWVYLACSSFRHGALIPHLEVSGTPLICHDVPPARSYIAGKLSGLLVPTTATDTLKPAGIVCFDSLMATLGHAAELNELSLKGLQRNAYAGRRKRIQDFERFLLKEVLV
jgi:hypothetical protein